MKSLNMNGLVKESIKVILTNGVTLVLRHYGLNGEMMVKMVNTLE
nr:MAG TPA: hypothetical protein [Caudoviricetes sp.]